MNAHKAKAPYVPALMNVIAEAAGFEAAVKFARALNGKRMRVPTEAHPGHWIVKAAGVQAADAVMRVYGGQDIQVPSGRATIRTLVAMEVVARGGTNNDIAERCDCSWRQAGRLRKLVKELLAQGEQLYTAIAIANGAGPQLDFEAWMREQDQKPTI